MREVPTQAQVNQVLATFPGGDYRKWGAVCPHCHSRNHVQLPKHKTQTCPECGTKYRLPDGALTAQEAREQ